MSDLLAPVLSDQWGQDKSWKLSRYEAAGGYRALRKALLGMTQAEVIAEHLIVSTVGQTGESLIGQNTTEVEVLVPADSVAEVLTAVGGDGALVLVPGNAGS